MIFGILSVHGVCDTRWLGRYLVLYWWIIRLPECDGACRGVFARSVSVVAVALGTVGRDGNSGIANYQPRER